MLNEQMRSIKKELGLEKVHTHNTTDDSIYQVLLSAYTPQYSAYYECRCTALVCAYSLITVLGTCIR
jgi:hypothetical protein